MKKDDIITDEERKTQDMSAVAEYGGEKSNRAKLVETEKDEYCDEPVKDNTLEGRMSNFWYHYKWHTVFIFAAVILLVAGIFQLSGREKTDVSVMYTGPSVISGDNYTALKAAFGEVLTEDINGDGSKCVNLYAITYFSEKQIEAQKKIYASQGINDTVHNVQANNEAYTNFNNMVFAGEAGVMFLDYDLFVSVRDAGGLVTLESALGGNPVAAIDDYGVRLGDTAFYNYYGAAQRMPADTVICLRGPSTVGGVFTSKNSAEKTFEKNKKLFCDIINFDFPEGYSG